MTSNVLDYHRRPANSPLMIISSQQREKEIKEKEKEKCPRCESRDTKFCYYNNYNTSQPRHFCRFCRRYWTLGGSLRNVPIGGSSRNKRLRPNPTPSSSTPYNNHVSVSQLMAAAIASPFDHPLFRFDLGLGLGSMTNARPHPSASSPASMEGLGLGVGPASVVWQVENGNGIIGECGGGPTNGEVN